MTNTFTAKLGDRTFEVEPFNEVEFKSLYASITRDGRDPSNNAFAIDVFIEAIPSFLESGVVRPKRVGDGYKWNAFIPQEDIFNFTVEVMICQRKHAIAQLEALPTSRLTPKQRTELGQLKDGLERLQGYLQIAAKPLSLAPEETTDVWANGNGGVTLNTTATEVEESEEQLEQRLAVVRAKKSS